MIDYFSHVSALQTCFRSLYFADLPDPFPALSEALQAADSEPGAALLGTLVDQLLQFSQAKTSVELTILSKAAVLYKTALNIYTELGVVRTSMEAGITTPTAPGALHAYNAALASLPKIGTAVQTLTTDLKKFQAEYSGDWMVPVGQQLDAPVQNWAWRDVFLGRRTSAFVANAQSSATTAKQKAFALGTFAGALGNLLGSRAILTRSSAARAGPINCVIA
jgi:hypothetical protein